MVEYNQYTSHPKELINTRKSELINTHPDFHIGINVLPDQSDVFINLKPHHTTPTGLRTVEMPFSWFSYSDNSKIVAKGYAVSPVHIYGAKSEAAVQRKMKVAAEDGDFGKAADYDFMYEKSILEQLRNANPEMIADPNAPIWQLIGISPTNEEIIDTSEVNTKIHKGYVVLRRFPYTYWRVADTFFNTASQNIESELTRLQSLWNVDTREGVYTKSIKRLARALSYMRNATVNHGNLYWKWFDKELGQTYGRPNPHNIALDGSIGDFEIRDRKYGHDLKDIDIRETLGAFSIYSLLIAERNPELLKDAKFTSRFISTFKQGLPIQTRQRLSTSQESHELIRDYETRLDLSRSGKKTMSGMEYFDDNFFVERGHLMINLLNSLILEKPLKKITIQSSHIGSG